MNVDKLKQHYDWLKQMVAEATCEDDRAIYKAEMCAVDYQLRVAITEGISIDSLIGLVERKGNNGN